MPTSPPPERSMTTRQKERVDSLIGSWKAVGLGFLIGLVLCAGLMTYLNTDVAKANRLAGMREACAAGRAEPLNCVKEGVPMSWALTTP